MPTCQICDYTEGKKNLTNDNQRPIGYERITLTTAPYHHQLFYKL